MTRNQILHKLSIAAANVVYGGYSVDHIRFDNGSAALRVYDAERGLFNLTYCFEGKDPVDVSAIRIEQCADILDRWFGKQPVASNAPEPRPAVRAAFIRQTAAERRKADYERRLADWQRTPTPPAKASLPLGQGWSISLRRQEVFVDDPGQGTPATVCGPFGASSTLTCALHEGTVRDRDWNDIDIPNRVLEALEVAEDYANAYIELVTQWLAKQGV